MGTFAGASDAAGGRAVSVEAKTHDVVWPDVHLGGRLVRRQDLPELAPEDGARAGASSCGAEFGRGWGIGLGFGDI